MIVASRFPALPQKTPFSPFLCLRTEGREGGKNGCSSCFFEDPQQEIFERLLFATFQVSSSTSYMNMTLPQLVEELRTNQPGVPIRNPIVDFGFHGSCGLMAITQFFHFATWISGWWPGWWKPFESMTWLRAN